MQAISELAKGILKLCESSPLPSKRRSEVIGPVPWALTSTGGDDEQRMCSTWTSYVTVPSMTNYIDMMLLVADVTNGLNPSTNVAVK